MNLHTAAAAQDGSTAATLQAIYRHVADVHQRLAFTTELGPEDKADCLADLLAAMEGLEPFLPPLGGQHERRAG